MFKAISALSKSIVEIVKSLFLIVSSLFSIVCNLTKALCHIFSTFYIRHKGNKEIEKLKSEIEQQEHSSLGHK
ncbi:hypothetical protein [Vibrio sp. ED002]|uniref:hypothetical protein n=1 Tax=Vibrio sp. ED002 TaxID=2785123 RepID=UPI002010B48F|nr:hypothetical protein [Vibrio sp. ED002]UQA51420.1 hypothetical protein ITG12_03580 [Vibrio sp. ED002]